MELLKINYGVTCTGNCIDCAYYFTCTSAKKQDIINSGRMRLIRQQMSKIKNKVAVISGKGGVGKSTVSANLAIALARNHRVGIVDSDFDGPCIPKLLGVEKRRFIISHDGYEPIIGPLNIAVASTDFLLEEDEFNVWFHELKRNALEEFLARVNFGALDYLILDLPPGTSSETANIFKYIPDLKGVIIVTIPSQLSQNVARRAVRLSQQAGVNILGIVENMSGILCPDCGKIINPFQAGGGGKLAQELNVTFLGGIPLDPSISALADNSVAFMLENNNLPLTETFNAIVEKIVAAIE